MAGRVPGEVGLWVLIFGDMVVFAVMFISFLVQRAQAPELFRRGQDTLDRDLAALNTLVLLTSSLLVVLAMRAIRAEALRRAPLLVGGAVICGLGFVAIKAAEWGEKIHAGLTPATNEFYSYYFVLTGLHLAHVVIGIGVLLVLLVRSRRPLSGPGSLRVVEGCACFWHMVDLLWIMLFPLVYLVR